MKRFTAILVLVLPVLLTGFYQNTSAQTGSQVLKKAIAFHDSLNTWSSFSGKVSLITALPGNQNSGGEIIEINTKDGFYSNEKPPSKTVRGIKNGEYFLELNGDKRTPNENQIASILQYKNWHYFHVGLLQELEASGLVLGDRAETVQFKGDKCLAISFTYDPGRIKNDFYKDCNWTVYIDPVNYSMKGFKETGVMKRYAVCTGILKVNGLKIPLCRTYFNNADDSFAFVDLFSETFD